MPDSQQAAYRLLDHQDGNDTDVEAARSAHRTVKANSEDLKAGADRRKALFEERVGSAVRLSFCREHYCRLPTRKTSPWKLSNLCGLTNAPAFQAVELLLLTRILAVYDVVSDIIVTSLIDRQLDPWWFSISIFLIALPVLLKSALFYTLTVDRLEKQCEGIANRGFCICLYTFIAPPLFFFIDSYLLLLYPWLTPTDTAFLGTLERLSPLIETFFEGSLQSSFQMYMWIRCKFLRGREHSQQSNQSLPRMLLLSFLPAMVGMLKKLYDLSLDAKAAGISLPSYIAELFKGPLGISAPFLTLLNKRPAVHYEGMGPLTQFQAPIFAALGKDNVVLSEITFDSGNAIDTLQLASAIKENLSLQLVAVGELPFATVVDFMQALPQREDLAVGVNGQLFTAYDRACFLRDLEAHRLEQSNYVTEGPKVGPEAYKVFGRYYILYRRYRLLAETYVGPLPRGSETTTKEMQAVRDALKEELRKPENAAICLQRWIRTGFRRIIDRRNRKLVQRKQA